MSNIGHGHPAVVEAISTQAGRVAFAHLSRWTSRPLMDLARRVADLAPGNLNRVYFVSGGSEATESALKMARQYFLERDGKTDKYKIVSRWKSFHGNTIGALSMTGDRRRYKYTPLLLDFPHIAPAYCYRCPFEREPSSCGLACAHDLERTIRQVGAEYIAAFIAEPVGGAACGAIVPPEGYFRVVREICDRYDILFIADEVMTGFGRTGHMFAMERYGAAPDLMCTAKGMSAGYIPLGAVVASEDVFQVFHHGSGAFEHGHTYGGNPLAAAVSLAVLDVIEKEGLVENARTMGGYLLGELKDKLAPVPIVGDVRGAGLLLGVELVADRPSKRPFPPARGVAEKAAQVLMEHGVVVYPGTGSVDGTSGDHFLLAPPLIITREQVDELVTGLVEGLTRLEKVLRAEGAE